MDYCSNDVAGGVGYDTSSLVVNDLLGTARTATPSLGAFELASVIEAAVQKLKGVICHGATFK